MSEIATPTAPTSVIDFDTMLWGPTSVGAVNAASAPPAASISNIQALRGTGGTGVYNTNATQNALCFVNNALTIIAPGRSFDAVGFRIDLVGPSTEIGFGIGDWMGPVVIDFYLGGALQTTFTSSTYSTEAVKHYRMSGGMFDRLDIRGSTLAASFVLVDLEVQRGLFADFSAMPTTGASPLTVQFTDRSFSGDPQGIRGWGWDFENDGTVDSRAQNPVHTYPCGNFTVSLTVVDATGTANETKRNLVLVDTITPSFTYSTTGGVTQFTDTSTPTPTSWSWDLDGDGTPDSTARNPTFNYAGCRSANVTLTVRNRCGNAFSITEQVVAAPLSLQTTFAGGNATGGSYVGNLFDCMVTNPEGITVCAITVTPAGQPGPFTVEIHLTPGTYLGNESNPAVWRLAGLGSSTFPGGGFQPPTPVTVPISPSMHIPNGSYGVAVYLTNGGSSVGLAYTNGPLGPFSDANLTLFPRPSTAPGCSSTGLFTGCRFTPRVANVAFHYGTCSGAAFPGYGTFALGCAGFNGLVPTNSASPAPRLGAPASFKIGNMPSPEAAIMVLGFSRTAAPFDLGVLGAPGCAVHVQPAVNMLLLGSGGNASWNLRIPNDRAFLCQQFFTQALVLDAAANTLGATTSDAAHGVIGI